MFERVLRKFKAFVFYPDKKVFLRDAKLIYDKNSKQHFIKIKEDKIPAPENIYDYVVNDYIFIRREGTSTYRFLKPKPDAEKEEINFESGYLVTPEQFYEELARMHARLERMKGWLTKFMPLILVAIIAIVIGVFISIVWSSTGSNLEKISANFDEAMKILQNITLEQNKLLSEIAIGKPVPGR